MLEKYNGHTDTDAAIWLNNFNRLAGIHRWDDDSKCQILPLYVQDNISVWLDSLPTPTKATWPQLEQAFRDRYLPHATAKWEALEKLRQYKQNQGEQVEDYLQTMQTLATKADKDITTMTDLVISGMLPDIKREVIRQNCTTITDITKAAREAQTFNNCQTHSNLERMVQQLTEQMAHMAPVIAATQQNSVSSHQTRRQRPQRQRPTGQCRSCGEFSHFRSQCRHKNATCYNCNKFGHIARACLQAKVPTTPQQ